MTAILVYGGSFDPPHCGHLNTLLNIEKTIPFHQVILIPCKTPVLKAPTKASAEDRLTMLKLLIKHYPKFTLTRMEIDRESPSFMVDTLKHLRETLNSNDAITLLLGMDAFESIPHWHCAELLPKLCNLLVIERQGIDFHPSASWIKQTGFTLCDQVTELLSSPHGKLVQFDAGQYSMSSTHIRHHIKHHEPIGDALPNDILDYIRDHGLYS